MSSTATTTTTGGACSGYNGILYISQGDVEGAAGTVFFFFVLNQILYADMHNLMPWVHLNGVSHYVYDQQVHGAGPPTTFTMRHGVKVAWTGFVDSISHERVTFPGPPMLETKESTLTERKVTVYGNGVWNSYFEPVSRFSPSNNNNNKQEDPSCARLPLIRLTKQQIIPALHVNCPWALRAWRYGGVPPSLQRGEYNEWFTPMRQRGHAAVQTHVRFLPHMKELARTANPNSDNGGCLAVHIRHSDKANRRRRIPVHKFLPYVQAYVQEQGKAKKVTTSTVYLATDSQLVMEEIQTTWPSDVVSQVRWQDQVIRSNDTTPVFTLSSSHHATNTQVLVDILAMSKCQFMLHGLSAVSEAAHYLNIDLHQNRSVNLDIPKHANADQFRDMVRSGISIK